ncbi:MAG: chromate efflux transporter [Fibrobacteria bacterium]
MAPKGEIRTVAGLFLKLGFTAFGGPAVHIALMRRETVDKRRWLSEQAFLDLIGATNLIPGPNSTEMAIHIGYLRAGWPGLIVAGVCFIVPAMLMVMGLAWIYARSGSLPQVGWLLYGVKPVVVALLAHALWNLGRKAIRTPIQKAGFAVILAWYFLGGNEIALLLVGGAALAMGSRRGGPAAAAIPIVAGKLPYSLGLLFLKFLRIGSVLYGSGYVLLPFLRRELVERTGWLTETQLLDAVSVGQFTPGPFFTTASFIGYLLGGVPGGLLATLGIFLPAFCFVAISNPFLPRIRESQALGRFLDGVNVASLALMGGAAWQMGKAAVADAACAGIFAAAAFLLFRRDASSTWLIAGGGLIGIAVRWLS